MKEGNIFVLSTSVHPSPWKLTIETQCPLITALKITSLPEGAKAYVNGAYRGKTPLTIDLTPGVYNIRLSKAGYKNYTTRVTLQLGKNISISAVLKPAHSYLPYILAILGGLAIVVAVGVGLRRRGGRPSTGKTGEPKSAVSAPTLPGFPSALLSRYEPLELLGEGGFAKVFKVKRRKDGEVVAVKVPLRLDEKTGKTFLDEVSNWRHLKHPNIVQLYEANVVPVPYIEWSTVKAHWIMRAKRHPTRLRGLSLTLRRV